MNVELVATNGGPHPASVRAQYTLRDIISISPTASGQNVEDGVKLANLIYPVLTAAHKVVQKSERDSNKDGPLIADDHVVDDVVTSVQKLSEGSVHEAHFKNDNVVSKLKHVLYHHFATTMDIERKWKADKARGLI